MSAIADLHRAVRATLAGGRLGRPVFVRYLLRRDCPAAEAVAHLAGAVREVAAWVGQPLDRLFARGPLDVGQVAVTLEFRDGATALVAFARGTPAGSVDLTVLGNRGAAYHDFGAADDGLAEDAAPVDPAAKAIAVRIQQALTSGRPEVGELP